MTALWTSAEIAAATGGSASADFTVTGVTFDSREVGEGDLFVALSGESTDGHRFVDQAYRQGAAGAVVATPVDGPHVLVSDTAAALDALARAARARSGAIVIGVTGSVGKTGTKEALFACLDRGDPDAAHRSVKSYNNHVGVPLSLARMPAAARFAVFEMGMNHAGELTALTDIVRPDIAIVTTIAPAHTAFFSGEEAIADAKAEIFSGLTAGGTALVPRDSAHHDRLAAAARHHAARVISFGSDARADIHPIEAIPTAAGTFVTARLPDAELSFTLAMPGAHWVANAMAVLGAVWAAGGDLPAAGLALADMAGLPGRGRRFRTADGATIIDESYNANPASMRATLAVLRDTPADRRVAVLGGMRELGVDSDAYHAALVEPILAAGVDFALLVGDEMLPLAEALERRIALVHVPDAAAARDALGGRIGAGDAVLIKGSNGIGLSRVVASLEEDALAGAPR